MVELAAKLIEMAVRQRPRPVVLEDVAEELGLSLTRRELVEVALRLGAVYDAVRGVFVLR